MKTLKKMPKFKTEDEERRFWSTHDATDYFDFGKKVHLDLSQLKPSTKPVTLRLPEWLIQSLKTLANKRDVPYQSLMKVFLSDRVQEEIDKPRA